MLIVRDFNNMFQQMPGMPLSNNNTKQMLKRAGIDTKSRQYQAAIREMENSANGRVAYTSIQCIKNVMRSYDKNGDYIDPTTGLTGLLVTDENSSSRHNIISIPDSSKEEMFESTKKEFLRDNGVANGDTTKRSDVFTNLYRKMKKNDRLAAGHTLEQYERQYRQAFVDAAKAADPSWEIGKPIKAGALDGITRESVEASLVKSGTKLVKKSFNASV